MSAPLLALDVMGGDHAPDATLRGALTAIRASGDAYVPLERILLVGDEAVIGARLAELGGDPGFAVQHASEVIEMGDAPAQALRNKRDSSIGRCVEAVKIGRAAAVVSMGNTGACVGASTLVLGTLEGVRRPGIAVTLELTGNPLTLLDMGANIAPKPEHLLQYGEMGTVYMRSLGVERPRVGLLNVGEEEGKGTQLLKDAYPLLASSALEFVGNVEGSDLFQNACDVVVTDGFTGNVVLKLIENFSGFMLGLMVKQLQSHGAMGWGSDALSEIRRSIDYSTYGGALLLGVGGVVVIGHGRSDGQAVANALALARRTVDAKVNQGIEEGLAQGV